MKLFGIGLAILVAGAALFIETSILKGFAESFAEFAPPTPPPPSLEPSVWQNIWERFILVGPYISIAIMAFGVAWYWIVEPILYFRRRKEQE